MRTMFQYWIVTLCIISSAIAASPLYTMRDLRILHMEKNYNEFFKHALDIIPSKRDGEWKKMTEDLGLSYLDEIIKRPELSPEDSELVLKLSSWPLFKDDEFFREKRDSYFLKQIKNCFEQNENSCGEYANKIFHNYPHGLEFKAKFTKIIAEKVTDPTKLWVYVESIANSEFGEFYCHRPVIKNVIYQKLLKNSETEIHGDCLKKISPHLQKLTFDLDGESLRLHHKLLKSKGLLDKKSALYIDIYGFLSAQHVELEGLKKLSQDYLVREEILRHFQKRDLLPGQVFETNDLKKRKSFARIINRYFPEYLRLYAETCLSYMGGKISFATGNPTPACHQFFQANGELNLVSEHFQKKYLKMTSFMRK